MPLAPDRYKLQLTITGATRAKLQRAQDLLRHAVPDGDLATVLDRALSLLVADLEKKRTAAAKRPRHGARPNTARVARSPQATPPVQPLDAHDVTPEPPAAGAAEASQPPSDPADQPPARRSRYIPSAVRRLVWDRARGRCEFTSVAGTRCEATACLEVHHTVPFARGGTHDPSGLRLLCAAHNRHEARAIFGWCGPTTGRVRESRTRSGPSSRAPATRENGPDPAAAG